MMFRNEKGVLRRWQLISEKGANTIGHTVVSRRSHAMASEANK